ncbi:hypothetical protein [Pajaroellobacter abortibovis]|uniref:Cytochrome C n=1 Tax=Pajaroellobacter abortibovis TaxID=1882918 RepID=A0A1L6MYI7_9BACT|nr:hypothetical protein [Pajaroellobacter abortibovis]APS00517.1 hypothetical protein BCY86_07395 [Pajaroellobacter abortibovis]
MQVSFSPSYRQFLSFTFCLFLSGFTGCRPKKASKDSPNLSTRINEDMLLTQFLDQLPTPATQTEEPTHSQSPDSPHVADLDAYIPSLETSHLSLQAWMKAYAVPSITAKDFKALAQVLIRIADFAPQDKDRYPYWNSIARDGANIAYLADRRTKIISETKVTEDLESIQAACRSCHQQYRKLYQAAHSTLFKQSSR